jgi:hypothetical protein
MIFTRKAVLVLITSVCLQIFAQIPQAPTPREQLTLSQNELVAGSRKAIIQTGISDAYFTKHFKLFRVVDSESDKRVMWEFHVNEHQTMVTDAIGYNTKGNQRIAIHSVANSLGKTFEIHRTLSRASALKRMRACIGSFDNPSVQYGAINGRAELVLSAEAKDLRSAKNRESGRASARLEDQQKEMTAPSGDLIKSKKKHKDQPLVVLGSVNLITGKCIKGVGRLGSSPLSPGH